MRTIARGTLDFPSTWVVEHLSGAEDDSDRRMLVNVSVEVDAKR